MRESAEAGLMYYGARYYNPSIGRFVSEDPIGFQGDINLYRYVRNSPSAFKDPTGLVAWHCHVIVGSLSAGLGGGFLTAECESECVAGKKVYAWVEGALGEVS